MDELRRLKQDSGMTNQQIANASGVPLGTVNRVIAGRAKNPAYSTVSAMREAMSDQCEEQSPSEPPPVSPAAPSDDCNSCHTCPRDMPTGADFQRLSDNFMELNSRAEASFADALASKDMQFDNERSSFDKERSSYERQLKRAHTRLIILEAMLVFFALAILALYVYDVMNPTRGWFVLPTSTISIPTASPDA